MISAIKNNRSKKTESSAPTTFCGTGFAPDCNLFCANFATTAIGQAYVGEALLNPLTWCANKDITVINQSWHTVSAYGTITQGGISYGFNSEGSGERTYDDQVIDMYASTFPFPTICQAAGNISITNEFVNHKGYNTIVVGQDLRDGGMSLTSVFKNPTSHQELPHVTCAVNEAVGVSIFENSEINALAFNGNNIFAGTNSIGVFLSTNNGNSWTAVNTGLTTTRVISLLVTTGGDIFAGTWGGGVFRSTNNGTSWVAVNGTAPNNLPNLQISALAERSGTIFLGTRGAGLYQSTDNGTNWTSLNTLAGMNNLIMNSIYVNGTNLFVGTEYQGILRSVNNGTTWSLVNNTTRTVSSLTAIGNNLFAGTEAGGVFLSTNNGTSWAAVNTGLTNTKITALAVRGNNLFAGTPVGVFLTTDNGTSWSAVNSFLSDPWVFSFAVSGTNIFAGTANGTVFLSQNDGTSWAALTSGLTNIGHSVVTQSGATSLASAMCSGFATALQSANPTLLKHSPWAVKAILLASGDNVEGAAWTTGTSDDLKDGAGRVNGIDAWLTVTHPYTSGIAGGSGFYIDQITSGTTYEKTITIVPENAAHLTIAVAWFGSVNTADYTSTLSDLDLELIGPDGTTLMTSASTVNPEEVIYYPNPQIGQQYQIRIKTASAVTYGTNIGIAWVNR
jgi:hypothetical protein